MNHLLMFVLVFALTTSGLEGRHSETFSQVETAQARSPLIHFEVINMSGESREAHIGYTIVPLPVAQRVALQVRAGQSVKIASSTNRNVGQVIVILATEEGHLLPVV